MPNYQVQPFSVFAEGRKLGQFMDGTLSLNGNDEPNFGDTNGIVVYSDGVIESAISATVFQPIQGLDFDLEAAFLSKTNVNMTVGPVNGKLYEITCRILKCDMKSEIKGGKQTGDFAMAGTSKPVRA